MEENYEIGYNFKKIYLHLPRKRIIPAKMIMKKYFYPILICCSLSVEMTIAQSKPAFLNPSLPVNERVNDLISRMTAQEKVSQMMNSTPAIPRLHIAAYNWWSEALHGVARSGVATVFPQAIGMAAAFDPALVKKEGDAISDEARAMYNAAAAKGYYLQYGGLTFWSPNINIFRDPRWGRGQETYGEDPYLTSQMATAFIEGMQGNNPKYLKVGACAKHFAAYSGPEKLRHEFDAKVSMHDLYATYLPAFHSAVKAGVIGVMCAYNAVNGKPCCSNTYLLDDVLKKKWGFKGYIVSDCDAISDIAEGHHYESDALNAAAVSLKRGVNLNCGDTYVNLTEALQKGLITEQDLDSSLAVLLRIRFQLGMFDPPKDDPYNAIPYSVVNSPAHRALAKRAALESIVMLKNDGVLPLKNDLSKYFVTGPNADNIYSLLGNYYGVNTKFVTFLEGIAADVAPGSQVQYKPGTELNHPNVNPEDWTTGDAHASDVTIVVLGINGEIEGEEGESIQSSTYGDRMNYNLPENQIEFLRKLRAHNKKPIIAVITGGSPMNLAPVDSLADAVLLAWYPGEEGGAAVADIIFGKESPSGKLPVTFPMSYSQLPPFDDYSMQGRTYRYMSATPLYPFGFGLSYAHFTFSNMKISSPVIKKGQTYQVSAKVTNDGKYTGEEVAQLYISDKSGRKDVPFYALKGFKRIFLKPGESKEVSFTITPEMMKVVNENGISVMDAGKHEIFIAGAVPVARSEALGAARPVSVVCMVE